MVTHHHPTPLLSISLILVLYFLQGLNLGLAGSIPLFLIAAGATWKDRGTFNFAFYPFSLKLLWAPLTDVIYSIRFGRRKSWLVPIQLSMAGLFLLLSFYLQSYIANNRVILLTIIFFAIVLFTATQDICVDGLAISLFAATNPQWTSTAQSVGQTLGRFVGSSFLLTLESANFTNRYIRTPLGLSPQVSGLFSLQQFVRFVALAFLIVTTCIAIFFREKQQAPVNQDEETSNLSLKETYLSILRLFKKKPMQQLTVVSLLAPIGTVASGYMTQLALISQGVPRENVALVAIPVTLITIIAPILIRDTERPLTWFTRSYVMYLIAAIPMAAYVHYTPRMLHSVFYYPLLVVFLAVLDFINTLRFAAHVGFFASISDPRIGSTYMTLLVTIYNLGYAVNSSIILYIADFLPKSHSYAIAVGLCVIFGIVWFILSYRTLIQLEELPTEEWYITTEESKDKTVTLNSVDHVNQEEDRLTNSNSSSP